MTQISIIFDKYISQKVFRIMEEREIEQKIDTEISITSSSQTIYVNSDVDISGVLTDVSLNPLPNKSIRVLKNNNLVDVLTTDNNGRYSITISDMTAGTYYFHTVFDGDDVYDNAISQTISITVMNHSHSVDISSSTHTMYVDETVTLSGTLLRDNIPYPSQYVEIYDGDSIVDRVLTANDGTYSKTVSSLSDGTHTFKAVYGNVQSTPVQVVVNTYATTLSINVPLHIVYSDDFLISGTLAHNNTGISGKSVKLKVGSTVVSTTTTGSNGEYSFTHTPVQTGNHTFQTVFDGDGYYGSSESSSVTRNVEKETSVLSVTSPPNNSSTYGDIVVAGTLTDDDGSIMAGKTIVISENDSVYDTVSTANDGSFTKTITNLSDGVHTFTIEYQGDSNYTSSSTSRTVTKMAHIYSIDITSTKDILSYTDHDSATITATLKDNTVPVSGETLSYVLLHEAVPIDQGTATTDSNGQISFGYDATGIGDVTVEVDFGILLQEIFVIEDCWKYDPTVHTGMETTDISLPSNFELSFKIKRTTTSTNGAYLEIGGNTGNTVIFGQLGSNGLSALRWYNSEGSSQYTDTSLGNNLINTDAVYKWVKNGSNNTVSMDSTTKTVTNSLTHSKIRKFNITNNSIKELKVKAL